jgi:hypothetical protein
LIANIITISGDADLLEALKSGAVSSIMDDSRRIQI